MQILGLWMPSGWEWLVILAIGLLLFGRRLPEIGRSIGKTIVEFKRGINDIEDEVDKASKREVEPSRQLPREDRAVSQTTASPSRADATPPNASFD